MTIKKIKIWKKEKGWKVIFKEMVYETIEYFQTYILISVKGKKHAIWSFEEIVTDVDSFEDLKHK